MSTTTVVLVVQGLTILSLLGTILWILWLHDRQVGALAKQHETLLHGAMAEVRRVQEQLVHYMTTARREGYTMQPQDEAFGSYRITPEMEAAMEAEREGRE